MFKKIITLTLLLASTQAFAQQAKERTNDRLDIKKLEEKYWAAKDEDFGVVQNRKYVKADRFYLTASMGIPFNDPFSEGTILAGHLGYFMNERWGFELSYNSYDLKRNDAVKQFVGTYGVMPDHNIQKDNYFLSAIWVPFYAKMSVIDKAIIYFDMGVSLGVGNMNYEIAQLEGNLTKSTVGVKLGVFQQIFFSEHFAVRFDLQNTWSSQDRLKYYAPGTSVGGTTVTGTRDLGSESINDTSLMIGITYWH